MNLDPNKDRFGLTSEEYEKLLRESAEASVDIKSRLLMPGMLTSYISDHYGIKWPKRFCIGCGTRDLPKRRRTWCSDECMNNFYYKFSWSWLRVKIMDRNCCERCGKEISFPIHYKEEYHYIYADLEKIKSGVEWECGYYTYGRTMWEVHHIKPINAHGGGGSVFDPDNLMLLCIDCHKEVHRELWREEKGIKDPNMKLEEFFL